MRISDWSSDVCSSDLRQQRLGISLHLELGLFNLQRLADIGRHFIKTALTRCLVLGLADHDQLTGPDRDRHAVLASFSTPCDNPPSLTASFAARPSARKSLR